MAFAQLGLNPLVVKAVEASGYTEPTAVQIQAIPATLQGTDLLAVLFHGDSVCRVARVPSVSFSGTPMDVIGSRTFPIRDLSGGGANPPGRSR